MKVPASHGNLGDDVPSNEAHPDWQLTQRCVVDPQAREQLFRQQSPRVYRLARQLTGNRMDAEDVLQEVFVEVFRSIGSYRGEAALSTWMHRVTVRCAMRHLRKRKKQHNPPVMELMGTQPGTAPEQKMDNTRALDALNLLLGKLSANRRAVFILHEVEGYTLPETAALVGISVTAAKKCVWRARQDLQRMARRSPDLRRLMEP